MDEDVIASISVGTAIFWALMLFASGAGIGWTLRQRQAPISKSENYVSKFSALLNALPQAALIIDRKANLQWQNEQAAQLMERIQWRASLPSVLVAAVERVARSGLTERLEIVTENKKLQVLVSQLQAPEEAEILILLADSTDASYRAELYQQLVGTIAHELRTPLTAIMGHVEILNSCGIDEETLWRRSLGFVSGETERLARLVEDLLSLSRLDRVPLHIQPVNLRVAAEEALSALFDLAEKNNAPPILQAPTDLPRVLADPDRIRQVFLNLLDNAIKYASNKPVVVRLIPNADTVSVGINNRGPVIAAEELPHIFEPFWRGADAGTKGTGLGLAIVRAILEQHHTSIEVDSNIEQGTTFHFSLPIAHFTETK